MSTATHNNLYDAVAFLAGRCDWAFHEDGVGYNKSDTGLGHFLAELPYGEWTDTQRRAAWQMLRKYRRQLAAGGIDYDAIAVPARPEDYYGGEASDSWVRDTAQDERRETEYARKQEAREAAERAQRVIDVTPAGLLTARSPYNADLVAVQRDIPSRRWDGSQNTFNPKAPGCREAVKAMVEDYGFTVTDAAKAILDGAASKALASHRVELANDDWRYAGHRPFTLVFPKNFAISNRIKKAEGWEWNSERVCWAVKAIPENVPMLRELTEEHGFFWSEEAKARLLYLKSDADRIERATRELTAASHALDTDTVYEGVSYDRMGLVAGPLTLRGFQNAGVEYALKTRGTFIADDMGTGKTIQALIAAREANAFPAVVVVRASIKPKWRDEVKRWLPGRKVVVVEGKTPDIQVIDGADVIVINYDVLADWAGLAGKDAVKRQSQRDPDKPGLLCRIGVKCLVIDESHYVKTPDSKRTRAALVLARQIQRDHGRDGLILNLTGTPVLNRPIELAAQLAVIGRLKDFGGYWGYAKRYCNAGPWGYNGAMDVTGSSNEEELHERLRASCYIRRTKAQVLTELPEKQIARLPVSIDNAAEYREAELNVVQWVRNQVDADSEFLAEIADLPEAEQKIRIAARKTEKAIRARAAEELVKLNALRRLAARGKLAAVKDWIEDFLESTETDGNGEKLVVFAHHRDIQAGIRDAFPGSLRIHADDDVEERNRNMRVFQSDPSKRLIVCSMEAAREGLDLYAASNALFVEFGWNINIHRQAEDRIHRMGQTAGSCTIWQMSGEGTIDEDMQMLIEAKRQVTEAVTDGKVAVEPIVGGSVARETMKRLKARHGG